MAGARGRRRARPLELIGRSRIPREAEVRIDESWLMFRPNAKSHKARQKAAGSALSVKLEKYLSRPDYEGHITFIETFHEGLPQDRIGCPPGGFEPRDADSERDLNESG